MALATVVAVLAGFLVGCSADTEEPWTCPSDSASPTPTSGSPSPPTGQPAGDRPNIVLVMTDDQRTDELAFMPHTRELVGDAGVTFARGLSPNPLCCPARASVLTGQLSHNHGAWTNAGTRGGYQALAAGPRLPEWLQGAGYHTAFVGKHLNGYDPRKHGREPGWTIFDPTTLGIYNYTSFEQYDDGDYTMHKSEYVTDYATEATVGFIEEFEESDDEPFFIWTAYVAPHQAAEMPCVHRPMCMGPPIPAAEDADLPVPGGPGSLDDPAYDEADVTDKPPHLASHPRVDREDILDLHRARVRSLASVDRGIQAIVQALEEAGELDDTLVVFTSDNGFLLGEHRWTGKIVPYTSSVSVPLLMRGPGIPAGRTAEQMATTPDLTATFVALAGATPTRALDGVDLMPYATQPGRRDQRTAILVEEGGDGQHGSDGQWWWRGYLDDRYTYVEYDRGFVELYDRERDPSELVNVAQDSRYAAVVAELARRFGALEGCAGPACVVSLPAPPEPRP